MSEEKTGVGDDKLPEPSKLPLSPDEMERHKVLPGFEGSYQAPPADSYVDPLDRQLLGPRGLDDPPPGLLVPPGQQGVPAGPKLRIAESVLKAAAGQVDGIYDDFYKPAATLEEPSLKAIGALAGFESARAVRLAHRQWERQAGTVTGWLAHIAESLRSADHTYTTTDQGVDESVKQVQVRSALEDF
ncbi:hypothetical protein JCM4814A_22660 [Streptomyces phaeofaciens JCM 4814]|uniref:Uncharacterized protein n=1 Tax=Streptomyces phaeofaciens TaxID=68254 RepID=A0A918H3T6_9ACTN|nr:hypothetical protein [Streptomyces phaeofaciens]GGT34388.1 hypothetical protein GCM10010226_08010 [Streptomyces phaeofaciens]